MRILRDNLEINRYGKWEASDQQYYANKLYGGSPDSAKAIAFSPLNMSGTEKYITTVISLLDEVTGEETFIDYALKKERSI